MPSMLDDHTHFRIRNGDIFTTRGFCPESNIWAVPLYFKRANGDRILKGARHEKFVDEFSERYGSIQPGWLVDTSYGTRIRIPLEEITETYDPFGDFDGNRKKLGSVVYQKVINALCAVADIKDIGFIGSRLVGFERTGESDLDVVVRGRENYQNIRKNFRTILNEIGASCSISRKQFDKSVKKYNWLFNPENNDFSDMLYNRWPTVHLADQLFCKIRFTYHPAKDKIFFPPEVLNLEEESVSGKVILDEGVSFMPRHFRIESNRRVYTVVTYFWDYSYCVCDNDVVAVRGSVDREKRIIVIRDRRNHGIKFIERKKTYCPVK